MFQKQLFQKNWAIRLATPNNINETWNKTKTKQKQKRQEMQASLIFLSVFHILLLDFYFTSPFLLKKTFLRTFWKISKPVTQKMLGYLLLNFFYYFKWSQCKLQFFFLFFSLFFSFLFFSFLFFSFLFFSFFF